MSMYGYTGTSDACPPNGDDPSCSGQGVPHQDTVLLIYVFSIFGLILTAMICSFYACHLYAQRCERRRFRNAPLAIQVLL